MKPKQGQSKVLSYKNSENKFDYILCCGDIVTMSDPTNEESIKKYNEFYKNNF